MKLSRSKALIVVLSAFVLVGVACGGGTSKSKALLDQIKASGKLRVATDPAYPPQSSFDEATGTWEGFDIDVATEVAKRLGVQVDWQTPSWDLITAGNWNGRWDISVGSMTPIKERQQVLDFSPPYYFVPAVVVIKSDSSLTSFDQLAGKSVGSCAPCTYSFYIDRTLDIPGFAATFVLPEDMKFTGYDTDSTALQNLEIGRLDAVLTSLTTATAAIAAGSSFKILGDPVFYEPDSMAVDKNASDPGSLVAAVTQIVSDMHADGTLSTLSKKWFDGLDLSVSAAG